MANRWATVGALAAEPGARLVITTSLVYGVHPRPSFQALTSCSDVGQNCCYGASSGRFTNVTGSFGPCAVCCGWYTNQGTNPNLNTGNMIFKCPANAPNSGVGSGGGASGCSTQGKGCSPVATESVVDWVATYETDTTFI
ncbi:hypothetical protein DFH07DRAFT_971380 [Mycena maculata]|uniref:Uncharacterized protein n=1 Tax=Mycena maculata TaxID=230809 RepID=A0AAD7HMA6_9AGAR|nr:hypothetical protein DFH07DRAFT_971380 [Mycena maculata]